jgi:nitroreductase
MPIGHNPLSAGKEKVMSVTGMVEEDKSWNPLPPKPGDPFNDVEETIYRRRSVRLYEKRQVPEYLVRRILEAGRFAPSAGNAQTWKFITVRNQKMLEEMAEDIIKMTKRVKKFTDYTGEGGKGKEWFAKMLMRRLPNMFHPIPFGAIKLIAEGKLGVWHNAPTVILLLADSRCPGNPALDIGITGQNMVITAHSFGLGTCWVSFCTPLARYSKWRKQFGIRYPYKLHTSIAIGYPKGQPDGYVKREMQAVDWFTENGTFKVVY